jgi:acetyltransferase-like isoleucine patch superfamily enzyme
LIQLLFQDIIRNVSGPLGIRMRRTYYSKKLKSCGKNLVVSEGVFFDNPAKISVGNDVWIDKHCIFITGKLDRKNVKRIDESSNEGEIRIGNNAHIGIRTVLQAHGGITIGNYFTSGTDAKLYTVSNDVYLSNSGTNNLNKDKVHYVLQSINIGSNVWIGMQSMVIGGVIGDNVFLRANSISSNKIQSNSIAGGMPAKHIKNRFN